MIQIDHRENCCGCHACVSACPKKCITMKEDNEGFLYPCIDMAQCVSCGRCEKVCPILNRKNTNSNVMKIGYAAYQNDLQVREQSSSGGIFSLLAEWILAKNGVVVGAEMADDCSSVHHRIIQSVDELPALRGSKYVQSTIGDVFIETKKALESGKPVLFTGTPCQIGGLYGFLGRDYPMLYTQDVICHGVPSPAVWKKYVEYREKTDGDSAQKISFRCKKNGWTKYLVLFQYANHTEYQREYPDDPYMKGFLRNIYLRPSCYACAFKSKQRQSDMTLADFWGIQHVLPEMDDDRGTSFVWIHSEKGREMFDAVHDKMTVREVDPEQAIQYNLSAVQSSAPFSRRSNFFEELTSDNFDKVIAKYTKTPFSRRIRSICGRIFRRYINFNDKFKKNNSNK